MESPADTVKNVIVGFVIGIASMLPGISGATMAVVFGIYERLIRDVADLKTYLIKDFRFIVLLALGALVGMFLCAKVLDGVLEKYPVECMMFFIGLIAGQIMPLVRSVQKENGGRKFANNDITAFVVGLLIMGVMIAFSAIGSTGDVTVGHDALGLVLMFIVGVIVAISAILPGLSHSTILLAFGLMAAFTKAIADLDVVLLVPILLGVIVGAIGFAKFFNRFLEEHHLTALMFILGLTIGSIAVIGYNAVTGIDSVIDVVVGIILLAVGFALSYLSDKFGITEL